MLFFHCVATPQISLSNEKGRKWCNCKFVAYCFSFCTRINVPRSSRNINFWPKRVLPSNVKLRQFIYALNCSSSKESNIVNSIVTKYSLPGRRLKGKGKGVLGARETREAPQRVSLAPQTPFPFPFKRLPRRLDKISQLHQSFPVRCHSWDTWKMFDLLLRVFLIQRETIATQGRARTSNPDLSYPILSLTTTLSHRPAKILKKLSI